MKSLNSFSFTNWRVEVFRLNLDGGPLTGREEEMVEEEASVSVGEILFVCRDPLTFVVAGLLWKSPCRARLAVM